MAECKFKIDLCHSVKQYLHTSSFLYKNEWFTAHVDSTHKYWVYLGNFKGKIDKLVNTIIARITETSSPIVNSIIRLM